jgi:hypothetical protein
MKSKAEYVLIIVLAMAIEKIITKRQRKLVKWIAVEDCKAVETAINEAVKQWEAKYTEALLYRVRSDLATKKIRRLCHNCPSDAS